MRGLIPMAARGPSDLPVTPGIDSMPRITGILFAFLLFTVPSSTHGLPTRTERLISENDEYYWSEDGLRCRLCPAGTYVEEACTSKDTMGTCKACPGGTYSSYPTGLTECLPCSRCRDDQEEVSSCSATKNTVCQCRKGSFCPAGQSCEICLSCTTSCPEDQVEKEPCNSTSDMACTTPSPSKDTSAIIIASVTVTLVLIFGIFITICICRRWKKRNSDTESKLFGKISLHFCKGSEDREEAKGDLLQRDVTLQFKDGIDLETKEEIIAKSCAIIVDLVPIKKFEILMQHLGLSHNEMERAEVDNQNNVNNKHCAMLRVWYQKKGFNINMLLQGLRKLKMEKTAHDITDRLIKDELYVSQTQHDT